MNSVTLNQSRWAPSSARLDSLDHHRLQSSISSPSSPNPALRKSSWEKRQAAQLHAYQKFLKSQRRLKWKSATLLFCHHRALHRQTDNFIGNLNFPIFSDTGRAHAAETMFKIDFFEYYQLLERVLISLLECFGIVISADHTNAHVPLPPSQADLNGSMHSAGRISGNTLIGDSIAFHGYAHRFHANVLAALDRPTNPLHPILGQGTVRQYLGIAKEFRNRWKEVELEIVAPEDEFAGLHKSYHEVLTDLKLDEMLAALLSALEQSKLTAAEHLASTHGVVEVEMINADDEHADHEPTMVEDAMDWD